MMARQRSVRHNNLTVIVTLLCIASAALAGELCAVHYIGDWYVARAATPITSRRCPTASLVGGRSGTSKV
jgi:hypothetical protein